MKKVKFVITTIIMILLTHLSVFGQTGSTLTFTEIMFTPSESNGEFIEIYNTSTTQTVNLTGFKIKYYTSNADNLVSFIGGMDLGPGKYAVIIENDYDYNNGVYKNLIPADAIVLKISDTSFGTSGMANTTSRDVSLLNPTDVVIETYTYSADNNAGISDEKYIINKDNSSTNWRNGTNANGTPGKINSVTPITYLHNLTVRLNTLTPNNPVERDSVFVSFFVKNNGVNDATNYSVEIFRDVNADSVEQLSERIFNQSFTDLSSSDSILVRAKFYADQIGKNIIIAKVNYTPDQKISDNKTFVLLTIGEKPASYTDVVINEIMYAPSNDEPEWIELYNRTDHTRNLKNWKISDNSLTATITTNDFFLQPFDYVVISSDATISGFYPHTLNLIVKALPSFSNLGDDVILKGNTNITVDSVKYSPTWGGNTGGKSLERISFNTASNNPGNWKTSVSKFKATPSKINSTSEKNNDLSIKSISSVSKYAEIGKTIQIVVTVENLGKTLQNNYTVKLFRDLNLNSIMDEDEKVGEITGTSIASLATSIFTFNVGGFVAGPNQFIARVDLLADEFLENNSSLFKINAVQINELTGDLVVNEIMYSPSSTSAEWVEIYNRSNKQINLRGYQLANAISKSKVVNKDVVLNPEEFFVITRDSSIYQIYPKASKFTAAVFPTLNNSKDKVIILDSLDRSIDSLEYKSSWGGSIGKSIERVDWIRNSTDSTNWKTSTNLLGGTPGTVNSNSQKKFDLAASKITYTPSSPLVGQRVKISVSVANIGKNDAAFSLVLNRIDNSGNKQKIEESNAITLTKGASISYDFSNAIENISSKQNFEAIVVYVVDEDQTNNSVSAIVRPGYPAGTILVNEVMYNPASGEPEWAELYNNSSFDVEIEEWVLADVLPTSQKNKILVKNRVIASKSYLVVTKDSTIKDFYKSITDKFIVNSFPPLDNETDGFVLKDSRGVTIDSLFYDKTWNASAGKSLERISFQAATNDKSNWSFSKDIENGTPGKNNSVAPKDRDIAVSKITFNPSAPVVGQNVRITAEAVNTGKNIASFKFILNRINKDESKTKIEESNVLTFAAGASVLNEFTYTINAITTKHLFEVVAEYSADEDLKNNVTTNFVRPGYPAGTVFLNEVMYAPANGEPEWIELYNASAYDVDLDEWTITDVLTTPAKSKIISKDYSFPSKTYLVVSKDSTIKDFHKTIAGKLIVSSFANLNNDADGVVIKDSRGVTIDSLLYNKSWGGENGKSLERVSLENGTNIKTNWASSKDIELSTPGKINSVSKKDFDLELASVSTVQKYGIVGKKVKFTITVNNVGKNIAPLFTVKLFRDANRNSINEPSELVYLKNETNLASGVQAKYDVEDGSYIVGINNYVALVEYSADQFLEDNQAIIKINCVTINEERNDLVINEVMYAPIVGEPEWLEIYNNSTKQINLKGYQVGNSSSRIKVINQDVILKPEEYFVVAKDSAVFNRFTNITKAIVNTFPTLNNSKDKVVILDSLDRTIDSLEYKSSWGGSSGKSLERLEFAKSSSDSTNWKTSVHLLGATPGIVNSISQKKFDIAITQITFNPTLPLAGQRVKISVSVSNRGKTGTTFRLLLNRVDKNGSKQRLEESNTMLVSSGSTLAYEFSFTVENLQTKLTFEAIADLLIDEDQTNNNVTASVTPGYIPGIISINEIMYNPLNGEPEWIELYNTSNIDVDLEDWSITDLLTTPQKQIVKAKDTFFPKNTFLVIAKDSSIKSFHKEIPSKLIISSFANLNNDADGVVIKDSRNTTIDSIRYESKWGGENGKSLERKQFSIPSNEKSNWGSSKDLELSTPGRINSVAIKKFDLAAKTIIAKPLYPALNEEINIGARVINYGTNEADKYAVRYYEKVNNAFKYLGETSASNLKSNDSVIVYSNTKVKLSDIKTLMYKVVFSSDEDTLNNSFSGDVVPGAKPNSVLITEIMYDPLTNEPEWVEFINASNETINLKNWSVSDLLPLPTKAAITTKDELLQPGEFAIATQDTQAYAFIPPKKFFQTKFGTLGNTTDGIMLYDFRGAVIDSFLYKSTWGASKGTSLERISLTKATSDSSNWIVSISKVGATPGIKNASSNPKNYKTGSLVFNEIMYEPETGGAEFVELFNTSNDSIQVGGMDLRIGTKEKVKLSASTFIVPPQEYFILASDTSVYKKYVWLNKNKSRISQSLNLSNEGTSLTVKDLFGTTLDSVNYSPKWHNRNFLETKNKSLERINPAFSANDKSNWSTSVTSEGATPGKQNSIYIQNFTGDSKVTISPNPFSPDNDGFEDFAIINFNLPYKLSQVQIKIFDSKGRLVRTLLENRPSASNTSVIFNGLDDDGKALRIGIYILLIEIAAEGSNSLEIIKKPIVVARKL